MTRKVQTNPRRRKGRAALLAALLMGVMLAAPVQPVLAEGETRQKASSFVDVTENGSLTVTTAQIATGENKTEMAEDMAAAGFVVDLYKVADAVDVEGYDTYAFKATDSFKDLADDVNNEDATGETWAATAQAALGIALKSAPIREACPVDQKIPDLAAGMYLVVARGADLTTPETYAETGEDGTIKTIANSTIYQYSFLPVLVALPARGMTAKGGIPAIINEDTVLSNETSNNDVNWQYDLTVALKAEREVRLTSMAIVKDLSAYENGKTDASGKADPATFVFRVEGELDDITFSNVYSVVLNEAGQSEPVVIGNLPIGMKMKVTEVYTGANYKAQTTSPQTITLSIPMDPEKPEEVPAEQVVTFVNDYDNTFHGGGSVTNTYTKNEEGRISGDPEQKYDDGRAAK